MLDISLLRKDLPQVVARLETRESPQRFLDVARFSALEGERKALQTRTEELQAKRNVLSREIGKLKGQGGDAGAAMADVAAIGAELDRSAERLAAIQVDLNEQLMSLPNLPDASVPVGADEHANVEVRRWGVPREFVFAPRDHVDVGAPLGLDLETGVKLSGAASRSCAARWRGCTVRSPSSCSTCRPRSTATPSATRRTSSIARSSRAPASCPSSGTTCSGSFAAPRPKKAMRRAREQYLISTSEISLTNSVRGELLAEASLPIRLTAHTPCFRSEAGSAGRDTRGMIRQHQFDKVEMVQITHPSQSDAALDEMVGHAEAILQKLGLPYRVVLLSTGDMGFGAAKTFDLEVWVPAQNTYREISSVSNCEAFQARRMQTRFKSAQGRNEFVHTLNGSGLAVGRTLVAVLENFQNEDGSVSVPAALRPYLGGLAELRA
jgi:seryl-tRNA synthetase